MNLTTELLVANLFEMVGLVWVIAELLANKDNYCDPWSRFRLCCAGAFWWGMLVGWGAWKLVRVVADVLVGVCVWMLLRSPRAQNALRATLLPPLEPDEELQMPMGDATL